MRNLSGLFGEHPEDRIIFDFVFTKKKGDNEHEQTGKRYPEHAFAGTIYQSKNSSRSIRPFIGGCKPFAKRTYQS